MTHEPVRFPRREFLLGIAAFGSVGALGAVMLPGLPALVRDATTPLPVWASATPRSARAYHAAMRRADALEQLPCYCGCMSAPSLMHQNLRDCYFLPDGALNTHAAGCGVCQTEALDADRWLTEGVPQAEIRQRIDDTYGGASCTVDRCVE